MWKKKVTAALLGFSLLLPVPALASVQKDGVHITILHTNDMHARVQSTDDGGKTIGIDWLAGAIGKQKAADEDTLALDAGDTFHGLPLIDLNRGSDMALLMNRAGYDAMTPGNHDFNFGMQRLRELSQMLEFPVLSANLYDKGSQTCIFAPYKSFTFHGVKVAVVGLTTPETAYKTNPNNVAAVTFANPLVVARKLLPKLRADHDVVIGLMHMGVDKSSAITSERIAKEVPGFDVIIDGHSHTTLPQGLKVGKTLICQTGYYGHDLGKVELVVKDHKVRKVQGMLLDRQGVEKLAAKPSDGVAQTLSEIKTRVDKEMQEVVAESPRELTSERDIVRKQESELGNLAADAIRHAAGADIAFINGGSLRSNLPKGKVTKGDILAIFPFANTVKKVELDGRTILAVLEHSVEYLPADFGGFQDVSGLTFELDPAAAPGRRVSNVQVQGNHLLLDKKYSVAVNDFMAAGGDNFTMVRDAKLLGIYGDLEDVFMEYLHTNGLKGIEIGRIHLSDTKA